MNIVEKSLANNWISSWTCSVVISCMSAKCGMRVFITVTAMSIRAARGSGSMPSSLGNGNGSKLSQYGSVRKLGAAPSRLCRCVVPVRGSPAMTTGGSSSTLWISGWRVNRSVNSRRFLSHCDSWPKKFTMPGACMPSMSCSAAR